MNIIAFDTAADILSVALEAGEEHWYLETGGPLRHSELLMDMAEKLLSSAGIEPSALHLAVCMKGPGSFTGLRIGYAAAKGLALALSIPLAAIPTLDCMAAPHRFWPGLVLPLMDAKKSRFFAALYHKGRRLSPYTDATPAEIAAMIDKAGSDEDEGGVPACEAETVLLTGGAADAALAVLADLLPSRRFLLDSQREEGRARELLEAAKNLDPALYSTEELFSGPMYIRKSDAELNLEGKKF